MATPTFWQRLRSVRITKSGTWGDAEFLCLLAADAVSATADAVERPLRRLAGRCYRNAVQAKRATDRPAGDDEKRD